MIKLLSAAQNHRPIFVVMAVFTGAILSTLFVRMFSISLADLRGVFGLDVAQGSWLNVALNIAQLISMTLVPWFMVVYGAEKILISASFILFCCGLAVPIIGQQIGFGGLFIAHFMIGFCIGVYLPMTISLALKSLNPSVWLIVMAAYSLRVSVGMDAGVGISGEFVEILNWRWIYWLSAIFTLVILFFTWWGMPLSPINKSLLAQSDWGGMALKCLGLTLLYIGVVQGELLGWWDSGLVVSCLIGSAILMGTFIIRAYIYKQSFGHLNWIKDSNLRLCFIIACLYGFLMLPNSLFIPSFLSVVGGLKPLQIGQVTNLAFFIYLLCSPIAIFLARRLEPRLMMLIGIMIIGGACLIGHQIDYQWRANDFFIVISMQAIGECLLLIGLIASFVTNIKPQEALHLGAYISIARVLMPALAGAIINTYLRISYDTHYDLLRGYIQTGEQKLAGNIAEHYQTTMALVIREAHVASFIDGFDLIMLLVILGALCMSFLKSSPENPVVPRLVK
ncbi:MFS transporter [Proteus mirabilis]|uniref:MFS transporter n=1 Tax=Proteus mirabilis TaxID=584 RepID=UPI0036AFA008